MKKIISIAFVLVLTVCLLAGCRSKQPETTVPSTTAATEAPTTVPTTQPPTEAPTVAPTEAPTEATTDITGPDMGDMMPGAEDTVDPSSGANEDQTRNRRMPKY